MDRVLKGTAVLAAAAVVANWAFSMALAEESGEWSKGNAIVIDVGMSAVPEFEADGARVVWGENSNSTIKNATLDDEGEMYPGTCYIAPDGSVTHPKWFEGNKYIKAAAEVNGEPQEVYYLVKAEPAPEHYTNGNGSSDFGAHIDIGNEVSEAEAGFEYVRTSEVQSREVDGIEYTYRTIMPNGSMVLNLECSPDEINYLTVRLWGGDTGDTILWICDPATGCMNADNSLQPKRNSLTDRRDWVELNYTSSTPQYDGGFIYATYLIPEIYTSGRESVSLRLYSTGGPSNYSSPAIKEQKEPSRGIYDVYMTQDPAFVPEDHGISAGAGDNSAEDLFALSSEADMERQKNALASAVRRGISSFMQWQIYGGDHPSYMEGMPTRSEAWRYDLPQTEEEWKNRYCTDSYMYKQNLTTLDMFELFAYAYKNYELLGIDDIVSKDELMERVIAGVDFLCRAQGSNGGFYSDGGGWIGGPERKAASGNNLTGFGLRSVGESIIMLFDEFGNDDWNEIIDSDADGVPDTDRITAWGNMMALARDQLVSTEGSGHAPNQDMANIIAALRFNTCLSKMGSESVWKQGKSAELLDICFGFGKSSALSSYWLSPKGTILENFGSVQGGYSGDYGSAAAAELSQLAEAGVEYYGYNYTRYIENVYSVLNNYYFTGKKLLNGVFVPQQYTEGLTSNRNAYYPGNERYVVDLYAALELENDTALKILANYITQSDFEGMSADGLGFDPSNSHFEDNVLDAARLFLRFDEVTAAAAERGIEDHRFIMEDDSVNGYAWADEMARSVVIKDGGERIYMSLNWRNPLSTNGVYNTDYASDRQAVKINDLARVHASNGRYDRYGYADMYTDRYSKTEWTSINKNGENSCIQALMITRYGDYTVIMNSYGCGDNGIQKSFAWTELEDIAGLDRSLQYRDLVSGKLYRYSGGQWESGGYSLNVQSQSTLVLRPERIRISEVSYQSGAVSVSVWNSTDTAVSARMFAAQYDAEGDLLRVDCREESVEEYAQLRIDTEPEENAEKMSVYLWDDGQCAYISKTEFEL